MPIAYEKKNCEICDTFKPVKFYPCIKRDFGYELFFTYKGLKGLEYEVKGFCRTCVSELNKPD